MSISFSIWTYIFIYLIIIASQVKNDGNNYEMRDGRLNVKHSAYFATPASC